MASVLKAKDILGLEEMEAEDIRFILDTAESMKEVSEREIKKVPTLRGKTMINIFYEPSTRTRTSFEIAGKRLSADVVNISTSTSSVAKGETLKDTGRNLMAMKPDILVIRHSAVGAPKILADALPIPVINAGDGAHEHPTQALLDLFSIREKKGRLKGLKAAIIGDITHSRVARSNIHGMRKMGMEVRIAGPATMLPRYVEQLEVQVYTDVDAAIEGVDIIMMLRIQLERMQGGYFPSLREYFTTFGMTEARVAKAKPDAIIMHPGPINRGVEIAQEVADGPHSVINRQVTNGVAVRMAVLYLLATRQDAHFPS